MVLWFFVSVGAVCKNQLIDLKKDDIYKEKVKDALNKAFEFLKDNKIISSNYTTEKLYGKLGNEHPVSHAIRHTDTLPKKTLGYYKVIPPQKYYLDLYDCDNKIFYVDRLAYLYYLVFGDSLKDIKKITLDFVKKQYSEYSIYLFEKTHITLINLMRYLEDAFHTYIINSS